jgi:hypothetical protein
MKATDFFCVESTKFLSYVTLHCEKYLSDDRKGSLLTLSVGYLAVIIAVKYCST